MWGPGVWISEVLLQLWGEGGSKDEIWDRTGDRGVRGGQRSLGRCARRKDQRLSLVSGTRQRASSECGGWRTVDRVRCQEAPLLTLSAPHPPARLALKPLPSHLKYPDVQCQCQRAGWPSNASVLGPENRDTATLAFQTQEGGGG